MFWLQMVAGVLLVAGTGLCLGLVRWLDQQSDGQDFVSTGYRARLRVAEPRVEPARHAVRDRDWPKAA